jgi:hypothetical protein
MALQLIPEIRKRYKPGHVILECRPDLIPLFDYLVPGIVDQFVAKPDDNCQPVPFDEHISLMSLPAALGLKVDDLPGAVNYIQSPAADDYEPGSNVAFCWRGSSIHPADATRSIPLEDLREVPADGITFRNFCPGQEPPRWVTGVCGDNWKRTAELLADVDLVITVDTALAHLAGAMGLPCWILLPQKADFRWLLDRSDSPWYPSVELIRQKSAGDWRGVMCEVSERLEAWRQTAS